MKMRQQFPLSVGQSLDDNEKVVVLLGDIGVWSFHKYKEKYPDRIYNIGILEQATISAAAGLAKTGMIPVVHTIAPFIAERAYEQLKLDFGYQNIGGNFVSVGASYDYSGLGTTHYCPADVNILSSIPNMQIILPGTAEEFDSLYKQGYDNNCPTYYRISEDSNSVSVDVSFGKANVIKKGSAATVIAVGSMLNKVMNAVSDLDVTLLYYTSVAPFDYDTLVNNLSGNKLIIVEPYYSGAVAKAVMEYSEPINAFLYNIGIPKTDLTTYGSRDDIDSVLGLTQEAVSRRIRNILDIH